MFTMQSKNRRPVRKLAAIAAMAFGASVVTTTTVASAGTSVVDFTSSTSVKGLGSFSGTATLDNSTDLLTIELNNTSSKGYLYGFAFDLQSPDTGKDITNDGKHGFKGVGKHGVRIKPYGKYEDGAIDAGSNRHALAAGASETFTFKISGVTSETTAFALLDNPKGESMVAAFRGFHHGVKDRAGAAVVIPVLPSTVNGSTADNDLPATNAGGTGGTIVPTRTGPVLGGNTSGQIPGAGTIGGGSTGGNGGGTMAVPLPASVYSGMSMLALMAGVAMKRKLIRTLA